jgi:hypothetical protein
MSFKSDVQLLKDNGEISTYCLDQLLIIHNHYKNKLIKKLEAGIKIYQEAAEKGDYHPLAQVGLKYAIDRINEDEEEKE